MSIFFKASIIAMALFVSGCATNGPFGAGRDDASGSSAAIVPGSANDPTSPAYFAAAVGDRVLFLVDEATLTPEAQQVLNAQAEWLSANGDFTAIVEGHADEQGTREYNLALGARRANAAREYLISRGVAGGRLKVVSFGKERPLEICSDERCYSQNRRAVTVLSSGLSC